MARSWHPIILIDLILAALIIGLDLPQENSIQLANQSITNPSALKAMHYHLSTNRTSLPKRDTARAMTSCTGEGMQGKVFRHSSCHFGGRLQTLVIACQAPSPPHEQKHTVQSCAYGEICIDTGLSRRIAYCVHTRNFVAVGESRGQKVGSAITVPIAEDGYAASALLADRSRVDALRAEVLEMVAWERGRLGGKRGVGVGWAECKKCSRLLLQPLAPSVNTLRANVVVAGKGPGYLYLVTIS